MVVPALAEADDRPVLRIIFVDDEDVLVRLGSRVIEKLGHSVRGFTDPREAAASIEENPEACDLLLTDYSMPSLTGLELAEIVEQRDPELPVVLITGYGRLAEAGGLPSSVKKLLPKPFTIDQLRAVLVGFAPRA